MLNTPAAREPIVLTILAVLSIYAYGLHHQYSLSRAIALDLQQSMRRHMAPLVQRSALAPNVASLGGVICGSDDCAPEVAGWRWAADRGVTYQGECYGSDGPPTLYLSSGCDAYVEALHFPKLPGE